MTRFRSAVATLAAVTLSASLAAAATATSEPDVDAISVDIIEGLTWQLQQQAVDGVMTAVPDGVEVTLLMDAGQASGNAGCNDYFASYTRDGDALSFGAIGSTQMLCPDGGSDVEAAYLANLGAVAVGVSTGGSLLLQDAEGDTILEFVPQEGGPIGVFSIEDMDWILTGQLVDGQIVDVPENVMVTLRMEDGRASGNGGCNNYFADYELDGFDVSFGDIGATLMACPEPASDVETAYFANLALVASYQSGGIQMALRDADGNIILEFDLAPAPSIVGAWAATGINNGREAVVTSDITSQVSAEFGPDGELGGFDGCNQYSTTYEVDGNSITIAETMATTRMACASDELAEQAQQYADALANATTWSVDPSGRLELRDDSGALQVSFAPAG